MIRNSKTKRILNSKKLNLKSNKNKFNQKISNSLKTRLQKMKTKNLSKMKK